MLPRLIEVHDKVITEECFARQGPGSADSYITALRDANVKKYSMITVSVYCCSWKVGALASEIPTVDAKVRRYVRSCGQCSTSRRDISIWHPENSPNNS